MLSRSITSKLQTSPFLNITYRGFAATEKQVKQRIRTVSNIQKITKAMKMVAASKMRGDLARLEAGKNFGHPAIQKMFEVDEYMQKKVPSQPSDPKLFVIPISTDRGLCGSINSNIVREVRDFIRTNKRQNIKVMVVGEKGSAGLLRAFPDCLEQSVSDLGSPVNFVNVSSIGDRIARLSEQHDKIIIFYNKFISAIKFEIQKMEIIPRKRFYQSMKFLKAYQMEQPDANAAIPAIYDLYVSSTMWSALLNNVASEQSARMNAMENASKNAKQMIAKLELQKNKARQARITMELCEIISGASAI